MNERKEIVKFSENFTLRLFKLGSDPKNFKILNSLPNNIETLKKEIGLKSKMPINKRINELEEVGLLKRERRKGTVSPTDLTSKFLKVIEKLSSVVSDNIFLLINKGSN